MYFDGPATCRSLVVSWHQKLQESKGEQEEVEGIEVTEAREVGL